MKRGQTMKSIKNPLFKAFSCKLLVAAAGLLIVIGTMGSAHAGTLYTVSFNSPTDTLYAIDTDTFVLTEIGSLGGADTFSYGGLAYDSSSDTLFMVDGSEQNKLYKVSRSTGWATLVGTHGVTEMFGLAFDSTNGILYGGQSDYGSEYLYSLNTSTGVANPIGNTNIDNLGGLAYDSTRDVLVGISDGFGDLYSINRTTAAASLLFNGPGNNNSGLAYDPDKDLFWDLDLGGNLRSYDPNNGYASVLEDDTHGGMAFDGLAYVPTGTAVPVPTTILLLASGLVGLGGLRRKMKK